MTVGMSTCRPPICATEWLRMRLGVRPDNRNCRVARMADEHDSEPEHVTRSVDLEAGVDDVWRAVADPGERALWLDDADAATRRVRIDEVSDPGAGGARRLVWTWWRPDDEGDASTVAVVVAPRTGG